MRSGERERKKYKWYGSQLAIFELKLSEEFFSFFVRGWKQLLPALKPGANCNSTGTGQKCHGILEYLFRVVNVTDSVCLSLVLERYINSFDRKNVQLCLLVFIRYSFVCVNFAVRLSSQRIFYFGSPEKLLIKSGELRLKILIFLSVRKMDELAREKMQFWILKKIQY